MIGRALGVCVGLVMVAPGAWAGTAGAYVTDMRDAHAPLRCRMFSDAGACAGFCAGFMKAHAAGHCDCLAPDCSGPDGKLLPER